MIEIEKEKCCGCGACAAACPKNCIEMQEDEEGFLYPGIDVKKCISCERCTNVCPALLIDKKGCREKGYKPFAAGGWHRDEAVLKKSSSGGAFTLFADEIVKHGGAVYGCAWDKELMPVHIGVRDVKDMDKLRGAKYVQSVMGDIFNDIKEDLNKGKEVLFTGTPCECAGLDTYLGKAYKNLYLCDFVCHGVPSRKIFRDWKAYQEKRYHDKIENILFRNKDFGWNSKGSRLQKGVKVIFKRNIKQHMLALFDSYINGFLENIYLRPSCYTCAFKGPGIHSDFTIADFWGVNKVNKALYNHKGTSLIIINTPKGAKLFETVNDAFEYQICTIKDALSHNKSYFEPARPHAKREQFFEEYWDKGIEYVTKKYLTLWSCIKYRLFSKKESLDFQEIIRYIFVGGLTTAVGLSVYYGLVLTVLSPEEPIQLQLANITSWFMAATFAYVANRKIVFESSSKDIIGEMKDFYLARMGTLLLEITAMFILVTLLGVNDKIAKVFVTFTVIVVNYFFSKLWVFRGKF